ncbi:CPBP family glutamic-type intramembrane protease [Chitinophaga varians]|uniref:CPBP family glutamic-type intramembrane protease n=1 Tax=Chitinophaga varians TaxID=2202339 RepID=UPI00165EEF14|nr:CPBP family glutamic-type intramembrane protease [Chitinophaga varians]MBC9914465.1 CPBP family intramembrane metalloprotease [Chitinophaga varians]
MDANPMPRGRIDFRLIIISAFISILYTLLISALFSVMQQDINGDMGQRMPKSLIERFCLAILLAPPLETLICQALPYAVVSIFRDRLQQWFQHVYIITAALFFAFGHTYSSGYVLAMYVPGIVLAYSYSRSKDQNRPAFVTTMLVHLLHNGIALLWNYYLTGV